MWARLSQDQVQIESKVAFEWTALHVPGAGDLRLAHPRCGNIAFSLMAPPPFGGTFPARVSKDGILLTTPFGLDSGHDDEDPPSDADQLTRFLDGICHRVTPRFRYGLLTDGIMRWLDHKPSTCIVTATPTTYLLRHRLSLFKRELASRGIYYEDDGTEIGYELRFAIEDGQVPNSFHEPNAALAYTVSGQGEPEEDKQTQACELYDPEEDWETGRSYAVDYPTMPARIDVIGADLVFHTSEYTNVDGIVVDNDWAKAHIECAGVAAGLDIGASSFPALSAADRAGLNKTEAMLTVNGNAVDAADRVQCAAYVLATGGEPDPEVEARLSRLRGTIVRVLLGRHALEAAEEGNFTYAGKVAATLMPLAPGPFPRRAYAVIELAEALVDISRRTAIAKEVVGTLHDPIERKLALLVAARVRARQTSNAGATVWPEDEASDAVSWGVKLVEPLFAPW